MANLLDDAELLVIAGTLRGPAAHLQALHLVLLPPDVRLVGGHAGEHGHVEGENRFVGPQIAPGGVLEAVLLSDRNHHLPRHALEQNQVLRERI